MLLSREAGQHPAIHLALLSRRDGPYFPSAFNSNATNGRTYSAAFFTVDFEIHRCRHASENEERPFVLFICSPFMKFNLLMFHSHQPAPQIHPHTPSTTALKTGTPHTALGGC